MKRSRLTGLPLAGDVFAVSVGIHRGHSDGVGCVGAQLLEHRRRLLASHLGLSEEGGVEGSAVT